MARYQPCIIIINYHYLSWLDSFTLFFLRNYIFFGYCSDNCVRNFNFFWYCSYSNILVLPTYLSAMISSQLVPLLAILASSLTCLFLIRSTLYPNLVIFTSKTYVKLSSSSSFCSHSSCKFTGPHYYFNSRFIHLKFLAPNVRNRRWRNQISRDNWRWQTQTWRSYGSQTRSHRSKHALHHLCRQHDGMSGTLRTHRTVETSLPRSFPHEMHQSY